MRSTSKGSGVQPSSGSRSHNTRIAGTIVGVAMIIIGLVMLFSAISRFMSDPFGILGSSGGFDPFVFFAVGGFTMVFGFILVYVMNLRWVYSYVTRGAVEGIRQAGGIPVSGAVQTVKIKCRRCGALNDEDDEFCGKCGQRL